MASGGGGNSGCGRDPEPDPPTSSMLGIRPAFVEVLEDDGPVVGRYLYTEVVMMWNLTKINKYLSTNEQCVAFAEENELVHSQKQCRTHRVPMKIAKSANKSFGSWCCSKESCKGKTKVPRNKGTFFENIKMDLVHLFYLLYAYSQKWSYYTAIHEDPYKENRQQCISRATINDWYNYCRETIVIYQRDKIQILAKIGGPGKIVQINESRFGKRKYNRGRLIEGNWVIGMIEDKSGDLRLEVCSDNIQSAEVLVPLIQKHVEIGTTIHINFWKVYDCLSQHGYIHKKVNQSDPDHPCVAEDGAYLYESLWRRNNIKYKKDPFMELIIAIKYVYK